MRLHRPRRLWWVAVVQVLALVITTLLPAVSMAATPAPNDAKAIDILKTYRIVRGDDQGNLNLEKPITRAEMAAIAIRAMGKEDQVAAYRGMGLFIDSRGHWADGELSLAKTIGLMKGDGNGYVRPQDNITYAEALTLVLRVVQREPQAGDWPFNVIGAAAELNLIPPTIAPEDARRGVAIRGPVFTALARGITTVQSPSGISYLRLYLDNMPPVLTVAPIAPTATTNMITVTGSAQDAASVTVNGQPAAFSAGSFQAQVSLNAGVNTITVEATDFAGNVATRTFTVTRAGAVSRLEIIGPAAVAPGGKATYAVKAYAVNGETVSADGLTVTVEGNIGTFDNATRTFTAGMTAGTGRLIFTAGGVTQNMTVQVTADVAKAVGLRIERVNNGRSVSVGKTMTVVVNVVDVNGATVTTDYGRTVSMSVSGLAGARLASQAETTVAGQATFTATSPDQGSVSFTATASGLDSAAANGKFGSTTRVVLVAETKSFTIGSNVTTTRIRAELRDQNDQLLNNNSGSDIWITLHASGSGAQGTLSDDTLTIKQGLSTSTLSGDDGRFEVAAEAGTVTITGTLSSAHTYTVDGDTISINRTSVGNGAKLQVMNLSRSKDVHEEQEFIIRVVDKNGVVINDGLSYAFQVKVDTSNHDSKQNGIPNNTTVRLGNTVRVPVDDGIPEGRPDDSDDIIARTTGGSASVFVRYERSGSVTVTAVPVGSTSKAYNDAGDEGTAVSTLGFEAGSDLAYYGLTGFKLKVTVDSDLGTDQEAGATRNSTSRMFIVRAWVLDDKGDWVAGDAATRITLVRDTNNGATTPPSTINSTRKVANGKAEFRVTATSTASFDTYHVTDAAAVLTDSPTVTLQTDNLTPSKPSILVIRGAKGDVAGYPYQIAAGEDTMEVEVGQIAGEKWVAAVLYRDGYSTPLATSNVMDLGVDKGLARFPRSVLGTSDARYRIALKNGWGNGEKSEPSDTVVMGSTTSSISISSVRYSAQDGGTLTLTGYGFTLDGTVAGNKLKLVDPNGATMDLAGIPYDMPSTTSIVFHMTVDPQGFSGTDVVLNAEAGWFTKANAQAAAADFGNKVSPLVRLDSVMFDPATNVLTFTGGGMDSGTINIGGSNSQVWLVSKVNPSKKIQLTSTNARVTGSRTDKSLTVGLLKPGSDLLAAADYNQGVYIEANDGWVSDGTGKAPGFASLTVKTKATVQGATYVRSTLGQPAKVIIRGNGFFSGSTSNLKAGMVSPQLLSLEKSTATQKKVSFTGGTVDVRSNYEIWIILDSPASSVIEAQYSGNNVYFVAEDGWFVDYQNRPADGTGSGMFRVTIPAS